MALVFVKLGLIGPVVIYVELISRTDPVSVLLGSSTLFVSSDSSV